MPSYQVVDLDQDYAFVVKQSDVLMIPAISGSDAVELEAAITLDVEPGTVTKNPMGSQLGTDFMATTKWPRGTTNIEIIERFGDPGVRPMGGALHEGCAGELLDATSVGVSAIAASGFIPGSTTFYDVAQSSHDFIVGDVVVDSVTTLKQKIISISPTDVVTDRDSTGDLTGACTLTLASCRTRQTRKLPQFALLMKRGDSLIALLGATFHDREYTISVDKLIGFKFAVSYAQGWHFSPQNCVAEIGVGASEILFDAQKYPILAYLKGMMIEVAGADPEAVLAVEPGKITLANPLNNVAPIPAGTPVGYYLPEAALSGSYSTAVETVAYLADPPNLPPLAGADPSTALVHDDNLLLCDDLTAKIRREVVALDEKTMGLGRYAVLPVKFKQPTGEISATIQALADDEHRFLDYREGVEASFIAYVQDQPGQPKFISYAPRVFVKPLVDTNSSDAQMANLKATVLRPAIGGPHLMIDWFL